MAFQKLIQSTYLNKTKKSKKIKINNGNEVTVKSGDCLHLFIEVEKKFVMFKVIFVDVEDNGLIWAYFVNKDGEFVNIKINQNKIQKVESSN